jgi:2-dehydropantoate 2-reductase
LFIIITNDNLKALQITVNRQINSMNVLVMGAGAIGSVFGGFLAKAGHHVCLIARHAHLEAIKKKGLTIEGIWGTHVIKNIAGYESLSALKEKETLRFDAVLLTVKSYDTESALQSLTAFFPEIPPLVSLQNGLGNIEKIEACAGIEKTIGGRVIFGVEFMEPGRVSVTVSADKTMLGGLPGGIDRSFVERLAKELTEAGIPAEEVDDINKYIWGKVLYNCALNGLATLMNVHYGVLLASDCTREIMLRVVTEIFCVLKASGITLEWREPEEYTELLLSTLIPRTFDHHPSMLQDILRHKRTEIDALNGAVVQIGREQGIDLPYNWAITRLMKAHEALNCRQNEKCA